MKDFLCKYKDIFMMSDRNHKVILTKNVHLIVQRPYCIVYSQKFELENQIKSIVEQEIIVDNQSPWSPPNVMVKTIQSDGTAKFLICVDYRSLNSITKKCNTPS